MGVQATLEGYHLGIKHVLLGVQVGLGAQLVAFEHVVEHLLRIDVDVKHAFVKHTARTRRRLHERFPFVNVDCKVGALLLQPLQQAIQVFARCFR